MGTRWISPWRAARRATATSFEPTDIPEARWWIVPGDDKKKARLNCIHHLLSQVPYTEVERPTVVLPPRERHEDYIRHPVPAEMIVPQLY